MSDEPYQTPRETVAAESGEAPEHAAGACVEDFDPVPLRYRTDGLTPQKQRDYVEALADCGVAREAAGRIGVSEQAINRARRRADARSFDLACEAAARFAARRIRSIAFERAIEGTVRRHYYHGELKSEEVVHDNKLLIYLLGKTGHLLAPPAKAAEVAANWEPWMEAIEQGLPHPPAPPPVGIDEDGFDGTEVWRGEDGEWWTGFPPPAGFDGEEEGEPGAYGYQRTLSKAEQAVIDADLAEERSEATETEAARRDLYFGFEGGSAEGKIFPPREPETYETSAGARERSEAAPRSRSGANGRPTGRAANPIDGRAQWCPDEAEEDLDE